MESTTKPKPFCFVLMPFASEFDDIYEFGIKGACDDVGVYCERVDEQIFQGSIVERIYNQIAHADVIIADMTGKNPNVFYEVGYAHALGKHTILLTKEASDIPFDLKHLSHIVYNSKITELKSQLSKRVEYFAFQNLCPKQYDLNLEIYYEGQPLSMGNVTASYPLDKLPHAKVNIYNASTITYQQDDFSIGVLVENKRNVRPANSLINLADGQDLYMMETPEKPFFPSSFFSMKIIIGENSRSKEITTNVNLIIRIFTSSGFRDYPLSFQQLH